MWGSFCNNCFTFCKISLIYVRNTSYDVALTIICVQVFVKLNGSFSKVQVCHIYSHDTFLKLHRISVTDSADSLLMCFAHELCSSKKPYSTFLLHVQVWRNRIVLTLVIKDGGQY